MIIVQDGVVYDEQTMNELITKEEFDNHKGKCSNTFNDIRAQIDRLNRAMFGEIDLKRPGVYDMVSEIYQSVTLSKNARKAFWIAAKVSSAILAILGAIYGIVHVLRKILIP